MSITPYIDVIEDLSRDLDTSTRYRRLLSAIQKTIPCDAIALLRLDGEQLVPLAFFGLDRAAAGRRFVVEQHPRLYQILSSHQAVRFRSDSELPDPYDGLIPNTGNQLHVHDCMGISIYIEQRPWGVITLDALSCGQFDTISAAELQTMASLTRAVITANQRIEQLQQQVRHGHEVTAELNREHGDSDIIGESPAVVGMLEAVNTVANSPLAVLLQGETGVGKEIVARRLHLQSSRFDQPLVQLNCAALPEALAESELFGHSKGAFTGAGEARRGRFQLADGGTLFLDEVGEIPLQLQAKLLRALQEGEVQQMGSDQTRLVDVRIIAATNRDLREEVASGRFRADLYHRLSVFPIHIPALRDRGNDILLLAEHFLERNQHRLNIGKLILTPSAQQALLAYSWPGNVRELEHLLSRSALKAANEQDRVGIVQIDERHLDLDDERLSSVTRPRGAASPPLETDLPLKQAVTEYQRALIEQAMTKHSDNVAACARALGLDRSNLLRMMKRLGMRR